MNSENTSSVSPCVQNAQFCTKYCTKAFGGRASSGLVGEFTELPGPRGWIKGKGGKWKDGKGEG